MLEFLPGFHFDLLKKYERIVEENLHPGFLAYT